MDSRGVTTVVSTKLKKDPTGKLLDVPYYQHEGHPEDQRQLHQHHQKVCEEDSPGKIDSTARTGMQRENGMYDFVCGVQVKLISWMKL